MNGHAGPKAINRKAPQFYQGSVDESETRTDHKRWRLLDERGRQRWMYLHSKEEAGAWPQSVADKYHLGMDVVSKTLSFNTW